MTWPLLAMQCYQAETKDTPKQTQGQEKRTSALDCTYFGTWLAGTPARTPAGTVGGGETCCFGSFRPINSYGH